MVVCNNLLYYISISTISTVFAMSFSHPLSHLTRGHHDAIVACIPHHHRPTHVYPSTATALLPLPLLLLLLLLLLFPAALALAPITSTSISSLPSNLFSYCNTTTKVRLPAFQLVLNFPGRLSIFSLGILNPMVWYGIAATRRYCHLLSAGSTRCS